MCWKEPRLAKRGTQCSWKLVTAGLFGKGPSCLACLLHLLDTGSLDSEQTCNWFSILSKFHSAAGHVLRYLHSQLSLESIWTCHFTVQMMLAMLPPEVHHGFNNCLPMAFHTIVFWFMYLHKALHVKYPKPFLFLVFWRLAVPAIVKSCETSIAFKNLLIAHGSNTISKIAEREYQLSSINFQLNPDIFRWLGPAISTVRGFDLMPRLRQKALLPSFRSSLSARARVKAFWLGMLAGPFGSRHKACRFHFSGKAQWDTMSAVTKADKKKSNSFRVQGESMSR